MKRLVVFCDGTWNRMSSEFPTNVLIGSQLVAPRDEAGIPQIVYYDEGVGTSYNVSQKIETMLAGAFGLGLFSKIEAAYRFLIFNYEPGDEIFIFGFSRGAFTARSLAGLLRKCGIIPRSHARRIGEVFAFYKDAGTHPDSDEARRKRMEWCPDIVLKEADREWQISHGGNRVRAMAAKALTIRYLGVWDTVGALGVPSHIFISPFLNRKKYEFHDTELSSTVRSARHAVAVDEDRLSFAPSLWTNVDELNERAGVQGKYQQLWFPGDHGSVGGGGDVRGLSDFALAWVMEGAQVEGLAIDEAALSSLKDGGDHWAPLANVSRKPGPLDRIIFPRKPRKGPQQKSQLSESTLARLYNERKSGETPYRPKTLERLWPPGTSDAR